MSIDKGVIHSQEIAIPIGPKKKIEALLSLPETAKGIVLFAHGSGSGRFSPRNRFVAGVLEQKGIATLLIDLLTDSEEAIDIITAQYRFDINLLTERVITVTGYIADNPDTGNLKVGYFGASTGSAAALRAAAILGSKISAVVSRGGRTDLAAQEIENVIAPTLLIVGQNDPSVLEINKMTLQRLQCEKKLVVIPSAGHLFEEPGTLEDVAGAAAEWFVRYIQV